MRAAGVEQAYAAKDLRRFGTVAPREGMLVVLVVASLVVNLVLK